MYFKESGQCHNRLLKGFEYTAKYNLGHDVPYEPYRSFEGRSDRFTAEQQTTLSPCHQVRKGIVPTIVFHGTSDTTVPYALTLEHSVKFLKAHGFLP